MSQESDKQPAEQAIPSPISGVVPPAEHRWPKGQSGNPAGRPPAGASLREWINVMQDWSEDDLQKVVDDPTEPVMRKRAAERWLSKDGKDFDRIMDRTVGKPLQSVAMQASVVDGHKPDVLKKLMATPGGLDAATRLADLIESSDGPDPASA